jgi:hypothetical protein
VRSAALLLPVLAGACSHVIHPAAVRPGLAIDLLSGVEVIRHAPTSAPKSPNVTGFDPFYTAQALAQVNLAYGWRLSEQVGMQAAVSAGANVAPGLDGYVQWLSVPFDAGTGATLSVNERTLPAGFVPGLYAMAGKGWPTGEESLVRLDLGFRWEAVHVGYTGWENGLGPFALLTVGNPSRLLYGFWFDGMWFSRPILRSMCMDTCEARDVADAWAAAGLFVRVTR